MKTAKPRSTRAGALAERLQGGLHSLGLSPSAEQQARLLAYLALIEKWNATYNLTAIRDPAQMLVSHLFDSLSMMAPCRRLLDAGDELVDVGSGAGLPGIPLAIAWPELRVHLVEPVGKKAAFMRQTQAELPLPNVRVHDIRVQQLRLASPAKAFVSRAFASLADFIDAVAPLAQPGAVLLAMKGQQPDEELADMGRRCPGWRVRQIDRLEVPELAAQRCVVIIERQ